MGPQLHLSSLPHTRESGSIPGSPPSPNSTFEGGDINIPVSKMGTQTPDFDPKKSQSGKEP